MMVRNKLGVTYQCLVHIDFNPAIDLLRNYEHWFKQASYDIDACSRFCEVLSISGHYAAAVYVATQAWIYPVQYNNSLRDIVKCMYLLKKQKLRSDDLFGSKVNCYIDQIIWNMDKRVKKDERKNFKNNKQINSHSSTETDIDDRFFFPLKQHPGSKTKVNVFLRDVISDAHLFYNRQFKHWRELVSKMRGMKNDECTAWLIWYISMVSYDRTLADIMLVKWNDRNFMKSVTTLVKSLGAANTRVGSMLVECDTLAGRAVRPVDFDEEIKFRTNLQNFKQFKDAKINTSKLRNAVLDVLHDELGDDIFEWDSSDVAWTKRWANTPAGSHAHAIEKHLFGHNITDSQSTRRMFMENIEENLLDSIDTKTFMGESEKLENGKSRALFATDSRAHCKFNWLLTPIERAWKSRKVTLDPGSEWVPSLHDRLWNSGIYKLMSDYDDFNSQHSIQAMQIVIECLLAFGAPFELVTWCTNSLDDMWVYHKGTHFKWVATLPSGHRGTTFFNSILNAAYIRVVVGELYDSGYWQHTGDDVFCSYNDKLNFTKMCDLINVSSLRMNRSKQSVGRVCGEYLRCSFNEGVSHGYLARSISSGVSGNWVSENPIGSKEYVDSCVERMWTWRMRSGMDLGLLCYSTFVRRLKVGGPMIVQVCRQNVSLGESPIFNGDSVWTDLEVDYTRNRVFREHKLLGYATRDYMQNHVDKKLIEQLDFSSKKLQDLMLEVSEKSSPLGWSTVKVAKIQQVYAVGAMEVKVKPVDLIPGKLVTIFPLSYMQQQLQSEEIVRLLHALGEVGFADPLITAWGGRRVCVNAQRACTYQMANMVGRSVSNVILFNTTRDIYM